MKHQVRNFYSEGKNRGVIGEHELEISADGIIERTLYNETKSAWGAVEKIESNPEYTFIYMNSVTAHVIPTRRIIEGDLSEFLTTLGQHYQPDQQLQQARI